MALLVTDTQGIYFPQDPTANPKPGIALGEPTRPTGATDGFVWIPIIGAAPSGVPSLPPAGMVAIGGLDITTGRLYIYHSGAWHYWTQTA